MGRTKKAKASEEDDETLAKIYTNKNFSAPSVKPLETISEVDSAAAGSQDEPDKSSNPTKNEEKQPPRSRRAAAAAARASMAPKEVRRLDFVPYFVADKDRDKRRRQRAVNMSKSQGKKPVKFGVISEAQEDKLTRLIANKEDEEEEEEDTAAINRAIDKALMKSNVSPSKKKKTTTTKPPPANVTASAAKRINTKRRRSSASTHPKQLFNFPDFSEEDEDNWLSTSADPSNSGQATPNSTQAQSSNAQESHVAGAGNASFAHADVDNAAAKDAEPPIGMLTQASSHDSRRASFESAIRGADLMFGPIDDGTEHRKEGPEEKEQVLEEGEEDSATSGQVLFHKVRRSSRFFRAASTSASSLASPGPSQESVGSVFTQVQVVPKKDRRKSRRTDFVVFQQKEEPVRNSYTETLNRSSMETESRLSRDSTNRSFKEPKSRSSSLQSENGNTFAKKEQDTRSSGGPLKALTTQDFGTPQRPPLSPIENFSN